MENIPVILHDNVIEFIPVFGCDICNCIQNTALGFYWGREVMNLGIRDLKGKAL